MRSADLESKQRQLFTHTHTHKHKHIHTHIYIYFILTFIRTKRTYEQIYIRLVSFLSCTRRRYDQRVPAYIMPAKTLLYVCLFIDPQTSKGRKENFAVLNFIYKVKRRRAEFFPYIPKKKNENLEGYKAYGYKGYQQHAHIVQPSADFHARTLLCRCKLQTCSQQFCQAHKKKVLSW